jgi:RNA polymerase sigma factor (sigma-70 family)
VEPDGALFRRESARLLAALTRIFGAEHIAVAEDVVQETLAAAFEAWRWGGVPDYFSALLMTSARNRMVDVFRRERTARKFAPALGRLIESERTPGPALEELFLPVALRDDELRMMFSCCQPRLKDDVQIALVLKNLCGLSVEEIAGAFLASPAAIEKRLTRGRNAVAGSKRLFEVTAADFAPRLVTVHRALYLLFNEGYHSAGADSVVRIDLCREALRLVRLLVEHVSAATPTTKALAALMYLNAARLPGRIDEGGNLKAILHQDRSRWDRSLIAEGLELLAESASGEELTAYHVEAAIAGVHASAESAEKTPWGEIVSLYDALLTLRPSPVVALNRAMAIAQHQGPERGLDAIRVIPDLGLLSSYPFYPAALGELELRLGRTAEAAGHLKIALGLARNESERSFLEERVAACTAAQKSPCDESRG